MPFRYPESIEECLYFTNRILGNGKGKIKAWAYKANCPKCGKAKMGKPVDEKGNVKIRAREYKCPACGFTESKESHEKKITLEVAYTCPHCGKSGETTTEYSRKNFEGAPAYVFECKDCSKEIGISKKMKSTKKKGAGDVDED